ncbi:hypothetical protein NFX31_14445 [Microbacterium azadirachtae]|uniref:hypothetical protein n=1 Tax=Microbacterium azadirachtae TaxID=582680 RepID=UPI0021D4FB25|nr:hypothetical protein [Microbacterium azadirachtae]UXW85392.1 hypothetical protein NFX31_14445 [Microbacterium azadirachtae]
MTPRQSAAVYRRRRIVVLGAVIVVLALLIALVWALTARGGSGATPTPAPSSPTSTPTPSAPPATPDPTADASPDPGATSAPTSTADAGPVPCTAAEVQVTAVTDHDTYSPDENPQLSISLTNKSAKDCTMNVGTTTQVFTITSGSDTWWRSTDCQQTPSDAVQTIKAGATITSSTPVVWDRTRSSVDTCEATDRQRAPGGGAAYRLTVAIGGFQSTNPLQFLLN